MVLASMLAESISLASEGLERHKNNGSYINSGMQWYDRLRKAPTMRITTNGSVSSIDKGSAINAVKGDLLTCLERVKENCTRRLTPQKWSGVERNELQEGTE